MESNIQPLNAKSLFAREDVKTKFQELLGKRAPQFITSVLQIVASNDLLVRADPSSIYQSAAVAATLDLPLNNNLGFAYIVPYNQSYKDENGQWQKKVVAQFQIGYKGFKQLALRSGQFLTIYATDVREGEIKSQNRLTGEMVFEWIQDEEVREKLPVVGYVSFFKLVNGYSQTFYMTVKKLTDHARKYSQSFQSKRGQWVDDFHGACLKTVIKLNLSKNAPLSVEMQKAVVFDQAVINDAEALDVTYADNEQTAIQEAFAIEQLQDILEEKRALLSDQDLADAERIIEKNETTNFQKLYTKLKAV